MRNRILLILLVLAGLAGITAVIWFIVRPALPASVVTTQPAAVVPTKPEVPFQEVPALPTLATSTKAVDVTSPEEKERQAKEALKREALSMAARLNTYSNADSFDALRVLQVGVDPAMAAKLEAQRSALKESHPSFGNSWGQMMQAMSAVIHSPAAILSAEQALVSVQVQTTVEDGAKSPVVSQNRVDLTFKHNGNSWLVSDMAIQAGE